MVFARDMEFSLVSQSADEVWFALEDTEETYKVYPFHFHLEIGYRLEDASVSVMWKVKNINDKEMHFAIGAHPAFFCPLHEGEKQSEYCLGFRNGQGKVPEALVNTVFGEGGVVTTQKKEYKSDRRSAFRWMNISFERRCTGDRRPPDSGSSTNGSTEEGISGSGV